jgi:hypothetical protein
MFEEIMEDREILEWRTYAHVAIDAAPSRDQCIIRYSITMHGVSKSVVDIKSTHSSIKIVTAKTRLQVEIAHWQSVKV